MTVLLAAILAITPVLTLAEPQPNDPRSEAAVAGAMREMFAALAVDDRSRLERVVLPEFYAFDGGHELDTNQLYEYVKGRHKAGTVYRWSITEPRVRISGDLATITYMNRGSISDASGTVAMTWLEAGIQRWLGLSAQARGLDKWIAAG